jgi:hypothetical protein
VHYSRSIVGSWIVCYLDGMGIALHTLAKSRRDAVLIEPPVLEPQGPLPPEEVFFGAPPSEQAFCGSAGLLQGPGFTSDEVREIRDLIRQHVVETARELSPKTADAIAATDLDNYHKISSEIDHSKLLSKKGRILPKAAVDTIKQMSFFDYVRKAVGPFYLSDEEGIGHEQICFRIVRPHRREDVGSLHRDSWFWDYYDFHTPQGIGRGKVWVPVCGQSGLAGLLLAPGSQNVPAPYHTETVNGKLAFVPDFDVDGVGLQRYCGGLGEPILFNYDTLHVGSLNRAEQCRVSFEITVMFKTAS